MDIPRNGLLQGAINMAQFNNLSIKDINYLIGYLERLKLEKMHTSFNQSHLTPINRANDIYDPLDREIPVDWRVFNKHPSATPNLSNDPTSRGSLATRPGKRSQQEFHNPYECGAPQNILPSNQREIHFNNYQLVDENRDNLGLSNEMYHQKFPGQVRNVNIESSLMQPETTHIPGQNVLTDREVDRFESLHFDPQNHRHLVWTDGMPRGGYATRSNRLEY
jgi:hypothetical protein